MKITNWLQAEQIISSGTKILETFLLEYYDENSRWLGIAEIHGQIEWWIPFEEKYFKTKFLPLTLEIAKDMKQAKEYLGLNTRVEDLIQELNK